MDTQADYDVDWLYEAARRIGKRPDEAVEERFLELVGKRVNDDFDVASARRWALKQIYG
jgi:hypothetical protein